jgi:hypothetical protein
MTKPRDNPSVGIFFAVGPTLLIESTPLSQAERYGDFKIHERGHDEYWQALLRAGAVPPGAEYEEFPRGRVAYDTRTQRFSLLADRCVLRNTSKVAELIQILCLPGDRTATDTDPHYRCPRCLTRGE